MTDYTEEAKDLLIAAETQASLSLAFNYKNEIRVEVPTLRDILEDYLMLKGALADFKRGGEDNE